MELRQIPVEQIRRRPDARPRTEQALDALAESINRVGLISPIRVREIADGFEVTAGSHRLQALDLLGWGDIPCLIVNENDVAAEMAMIAENVHRAELPKLERDEQIARWIELCGERSGVDVSFQPETKPAGRPESGVRAAARELGINHVDAHRAVKVAALSEEAKAVARQAGLDDNRSALLSAAKHATPEAQVKALEDRQQGGMAVRFQPDDTLPDPIRSAEKFISLADQIAAIPSSELVASGRMRAAVGQRAAGLAMHMDDITERLNA